LKTTFSKIWWGLVPVLGKAGHSQTLFFSSFKPFCLLPSTFCLALWAGQIPFKKFPKKELTQEQKKSNKQLGKKRVIVENVIGKLKIFKIFSSRSRKRRKRFGLRLNLIAGIYNFELNNKFQLIENS